MNKQIKIWIIVSSSVVFLIILTFLIVFIVNLNKITITAMFDDLELYTKRLPVFYKGYKLGRVKKIYLMDDSKTTGVEMRINLNGIKLPDNITAKVKTKKKKDFIELEYPKTPSDVLLHDDDVILGQKCLNISSYIDNQAESGGLDEIKNNLNTTVASMGGTFDALTDLIITGNEILKDVRPSLKERSENLAKTSKHLEYTTKKLSQSTDSKRFANSSHNIEQTTKNIELATKNLDLTAQNLANLTGTAKNKTITLVDSAMGNVNNATSGLNCAMEQTKRILCDVEQIVKGVKLTLSKNFAGMRIVFGKAID